MFSASSSDDDDKVDINPKNNNFSVVAAAAAAAAKRKRAKSASNAMTEAEINAVLAPQSADSKTQAQKPTPTRTSRYIGKLVARAEERREEARLIEDRRLAATAPEAEQFVTPAYARALAGDAPEAPSKSAATRRPRLQLTSQPQQKKMKRTRFASATLTSTVTPKLRGLRRNDAASIEAYRRRYFQREAVRQRQRDARTPA